MMKSQGKDLAELVGQDDEDHDGLSCDSDIFQRADTEVLRLDALEPAHIATDLDSDDSDDEDNLDADAVENHTVWLPSHFDASTLDQIPALKRMVEKERELRRAHCDRRKGELNLSLRIFGVMVRDTKENGLATRARATIERQKRMQKHLVKSYQLHQQALAKLGATEDDRLRYPPLTWELLLQHRPTRPNGPRSLGSGRSQVRGAILPWLTMDVSSVDLGGDDTGEELVRALSTDGMKSSQRCWIMLMPIFRCSCKVLPS